MKRFPLFFALTLTLFCLLSIPAISISTAQASLTSKVKVIAESASIDQMSEGVDGEQEHNVRENEHGVEGLQVAIVAGSIIIAAGLAIGISRRRNP